MARKQVQHQYEAEELLEEISAWSKDEIDQLPRLYHDKAREYRQLLNDGE